MLIKNIFSKKVTTIFLISLLTLITTSLAYLFFNTKGIILKKDLTCNFREEVYLKDFIYKLDGTLKNNYKIDTTKVGTKELKVIFKDKHGFYKVKTFNIEIKDITPPTILVNDIYTVEKGTTEKITDKILCADDYDDNIKCQITGSYNLEEVGKYPITITAKDKSNNQTQKKFILNVVEPTPKTDTSEEKKQESFVDYQEIYQKHKNKNTLIGIDISKWQENIDFHQLKTNGVEFVIIKIAGQKEIEGKIIMDPNFKNNIEKAQQENIPVGLYFYSYAKSTKEAQKQADYIIKNIHNYKITLPIVFDWENWSNYNEFNLSFNHLNNIAKSFIERIESKGYQASLYSSQYYLENIWYSNDYNNIWIANYGALTYQGNYNIWQLCSDGKIEGINTYVDIDIMYLNSSN